MGKIFKGQTKLEIRLTTGQDLTNATAKIKYIKPDRSRGQFDASITDAAAGIVSFFASSADDIDQAGDWVFWAHATFPDLKVAAGEPVKIKVFEEGT